MEQLVQRYFDAWNANSVEQLRPLLHDAVTLTDWEISESGLEAVINANQKIFDAVPGIHVTVHDMATSTNQVMAQITVHVNEQEQLSVIDVLTISSDKITSIKAYKK
tara:strand:- start:7001 stop:7321 length:321 start_codon:yes stop_codon:yes gene_type:complete